MREIKLTQGKVALVSDDVFEKVNNFKWYAAKRKHNFYAARSFTENGKKRQIYMHRFILNSSDKKTLIDHKDSDGLNNTNENLRICNSLENSRNSLGVNSTTSKYKGVYFHKRAKKWASTIMINYKHKYIGLFENEIEAAKQYDLVAK